MSDKPILFYAPGSPAVRAVLLVADAMNFQLDLKYDITTNALLE